MGPRQTGVRDLLPEVIVLGEAVKVAFEREDLENPDENRRAHREVAALEAPDRGPGHEDACRHLGLAHAPSESGSLEAGTERVSLALSIREQGTLRSTHGT